jgi:hypothetical protein
MLGNYRVAAQLAVSPVAFSSTELITSLFIHFLLPLFLNIRWEVYSAEGYRGTYNIQLLLTE